DLVFRPFKVEAQHRDAPFVHDVRIDLAIGVVIRDHLATTGEAHESAVIFPNRLLERRSVTFVVIADSRERTEIGNAKTAADFDVIPARKTSALVLPKPPWHV